MKVFKFFLSGHGFPSTEMIGTEEEAKKLLDKIAKQINFTGLIKIEFRPLKVFDLYSYEVWGKVFKQDEQQQTEESQSIN